MNATLEPYLVERKREGVAAEFRIRPGTSDEKAILEVWKKNSYQRKQFRVEAGERWLDLGANIGAFSVYAHHRGCIVQAYEAEAENAELTRDNLERNGAPRNVTLAAIVPDGYSRQSVELSVATKPMWQRRHSISIKRRDAEKRSVPALRFSDLPLTAFDAMKMNIEGAEIEILEQAESFGNLRKLVFEYSFDLDPSMPRLRAILDRLRAHFGTVDVNKRLPDIPAWTFYPPNLFVYCMR